MSTAVRTAYRLNVNKSKFYALAKRYYPEIEPMRRTEFIKYFRARDYALNFRSGSYYHHLFLSVCGGRPTLGDEWDTYDEDGSRVSYWECHALTLDELRALDMVEEAGT